MYISRLLKKKLPTKYVQSIPKPPKLLTNEKSSQDLEIEKRWGQDFSKTEHRLSSLNPRDTRIRTDFEHERINETKLKYKNLQDAYEKGEVSKELFESQKKELIKSYDSFNIEKLVKTQAFYQKEDNIAKQYMFQMWQFLGIALVGVGLSCVTKVKREKDEILERYGQKNLRFLNQVKERFIQQNIEFYKKWDMQDQISSNKEALKKFREKNEKYRMVLESRIY